MDLPGRRESGRLAGMPGAWQGRSCQPAAVWCILPDSRTAVDAGGSTSTPNPGTPTMAESEQGGGRQGQDGPPRDDPWASLADELGVKPGDQSGPETRSERRPAPAAPARPKPVRPERPSDPAPTAGWDDLATQFGLEPAATTLPPARPLPREEPGIDREPSQRTRDRDRGPPSAGRQPAPEPPSRDRPSGFGEVEAGSTARSEPGGNADEDSAERRPRRRRGRRGGRGRRPRDPDRTPASDLRDREPLRDDLDGPAVRPAPPDELCEPDAAPRTPEEETEAAAEDSSADRERGSGRRRRRGRRGGRGRSRDRETADGPRAAHGGLDAADTHPGDDGGEAAGRSDGEDAAADEPLPGGYGVHPQRPRAHEDERGRREQERGEGRPRRRGRRRRSGEGGSRSGGDERVSRGDRERSSRPRTERRGDAESRGDARAESGFSRRRRGDFAQVGSGRDEDDEGLEFLGLDETEGDAPRRSPKAADDEIVVESGLASVQDVPSWVEAIGIVIAGNLDARSRSHRDDSRRPGR